MNNLNLIAMATLATMINSAIAFGANPACGAGHCTRLEASALEMCKGNADLLGMTFEQYKNQGGRATVMENGRICDCPCSCVVADTLIGTLFGYKEIANIQNGEKVITPISRYQTGFVSSQHFSKMDTIPVLKTEFSNGKSLVSSGNHTFITPDEKVISADQLKAGSQVLASDKSVVTVVSKPILGRISQGLYNLTINAGSKAPVDHVIDTNGILSGDWILQSHHDLVEEELFVRTSVLNLLDLK